MGHFIYNTISDLVFDRWGTPKLMMIVGLTVFGAATGTIIGIMFVPDDPDKDHIRYEKGFQ